MSAASTKKRVAVIGAGLSGLATLKELREKGHDAVGFEYRSQIGGAFLNAHDGLVLTTSNVTTSFGALPDEREPYIWDRDGYLAYLQTYAEHFDLLRHFHFSTRVDSVRRDAQSGTWRLRVSPAHEASPNGNGAPQPLERELEFDHVAICSGLNGKFVLPDWNGRERFRGNIIHSSELRNERELAGRRVLVVGLGEGGSDIALLAARMGASAAASTRKGPGYVIPRLYRGAPSDMDTNRCYHSLPRWLCGKPVTRFKVRIEDMLRGPGDDPRVYDKAEAINRERGLSPFHRFGTKNASFVEAILYHGMELRPDIERLEEDRVVFVDGSSFECDLIVCSTGHRVELPFLGEHHPELVKQGLSFRRLYKRMIHPDVGPSLAWIGFVRPGVGSFPPCAELQARYFALLVSGERSLPARDEMQRDIELHGDLDLEQFPEDASRLSALTDYLRFMEEVAGLIGCRPPLQDLFFRDPRLWAKVFFAPIIAAQYRLVGPGADAKRARSAIEKLPTMPWPVLAYELLLFLGSRVAGSARDRWRTHPARSSSSFGAESEMNMRNLRPGSGVRSSTSST